MPDKNNKSLAKCRYLPAFLQILIKNVAFSNENATFFCRYLLFVIVRYIILVRHHRLPSFSCFKRVAYLNICFLEDTPSLPKILWLWYLRVPF